MELTDKQKDIVIPMLINEIERLKRALDSAEFMSDYYAKRVKALEIGGCDDFIEAKEVD